MVDLSIATVGNVDSTGVTLVIPPSTTPSLKRYKRLITNGSITSGDLVLIAELSGTYVVLGKIAYS